MVDFRNHYSNVAIVLFFLIAFTLQCNKALINTPETESTTREMTDIDGNIYKTIKIGNQIWMAENLRVTRYNDGEKINQIKELVAWGFDTIGAYCFYNNTQNTDSIRMYGALYNNYVIASQKLAPAGWHVPSKEDWEELETFLISHNYNWDKSVSGNKIGKSLASQTGWDTISEPGFVGNDESQNNTTSFCAFPSGQRMYRGTRTYTVPQEDNGFELAGKECNWWTSSGYLSSAWFYGMGFCDDRLNLMSINALHAGFSVRLVKDECE